MHFSRDNKISRNVTSFIGIWAPDDCAWLCLEWTHSICANAFWCVLSCYQIVKNIHYRTIDEHTERPTVIYTFFLVISILMIKQNETKQIAQVCVVQTELKWRNYLLSITVTAFVHKPDYLTLNKFYRKQLYSIWKSNWISVFDFSVHSQTERRNNLILFIQVILQIMQTKRKQE